MEMIKKLTGKNPDEYEMAAKSLVNNADVDFFENLVKQDDFLFDYIKNNVSKRIMNACNKDNYSNLLKFLDYYSPSYADMIAEVLHHFGEETLFTQIKEDFLNGNNSRKAYALKYFMQVQESNLSELLPLIRKASRSDNEYVSTNAIELLSRLKDDVSKQSAVLKLQSNDEFEQYEAIKFLVTYQARDAFDAIIDVMKRSSLSENIASELPYLIPMEEILKENFDTGVLILCHIVNAIPEIISPSVVLDYNMYNIFEDMYISNLTGSSATLLRLAKEKFEELAANDEYLFDSDKNTKEEVYAINSLLQGMNSRKLDSLIYEELYDESDFVFFAVDYVNDVEELETLLDSKNQTLILKVLTLLKEKQALTSSIKEAALNNISNVEIKQIAEVL